MADPNQPTNPNKAPATRTPRRARKKKAAVETRRQKEFLYRGVAIEELVAMPHDEQMALLPSRARRFFKRIGQDEEAQKFWAKVKAAGEGDDLRTHLRDFPVLPAMVGKMVHIHNGKEFQKIGVTTEMIGHKLGEFALTRKPVKHTGPGVGATRSSKFMPLK
jgi:small subunit ribosomal protein S19